MDYIFIRHSIQEELKLAAMVYRNFEGHRYLDIFTEPHNAHQPHVQQPFMVLCKTRGYQCSFRFLKMGVISPETC
jgi:hypothetical protein